MISQTTGPISKFQTPLDSLENGLPDKIKNDLGVTDGDYVTATGGVSYSVGGAAAPQTLAFSTPNLWLATPIFDGF